MLSIKKSDVDEGFFKEKFPYFIHQLQNAVQIMMIDWEFFRKDGELHYLEEIRNQIFYVERLFSKLDKSDHFFKKDSKEEDFIRVDFKSLLEKIYKEFSKRKTSHRFSLELPTSDLLISVDVFYMQEALRILFENAINYTPKGEKIVLKLSEDEEMVEIILTNTGVGVKNGLQEKIFEPFERGKSKKRGLGLGLSIAQKIIRTHKGKIIVKSDEKSYVSFVILLPKS